MKLFFSVFISLLFLSGCLKEQMYELTEKEKLSDEILEKVAIKLKNELGLIPCGTGGGMLDQIKMLALAFDYNEPLDQDRGREFLILAMDELASAINSDERIRPYLHNYPFDQRNVEIIIYFPTLERSNLEQPCVIAARRGKLCYKYPSADPYKYGKIYEETYEEALEKIAHKTAVASGI